MELKHKSVKVNEQTFAPELEITLTFPLEIAKNEISMDSDFFENIGREFIKLISEKI